MYSLNPSYNLKLGATSLKALTSYSTAYITPSLYQLFDSSYGNSELNPEESHTFEFGLELGFKPLNVNYSLVYFNRNTSNFIDFVTVDAENYISEYQNIAENLNASGLEFEFSLDPIENLKLTGIIRIRRQKNVLLLQSRSIKLMLKLDIKFQRKALFL